MPVQEGGQLHFLGSKLFAFDWAETVPMRATLPQMRRTGKRTQTRSCHGTWALCCTLNQHPRPPHAGNLEKMKIHGIFIRLDSSGISQKMHRDFNSHVMVFKSEGEFLRNAQAVVSNGPVHVFWRQNVNCKYLLRVNEGSAFSDECARMMRKHRNSGECPSVLRGRD